VSRQHGFGLVGAGNIAAAHADSIGRLDNARLVAVTSLSRGASERTAAAHGAVAVDSLAELLEMDEIDVVTVCTPSGAHLEPAVQAARAGRHVIVEKPLEVSLERARAIVQAADEAGVKLATVFQGRFPDSMQLVRRTVDEGRLGRIVQADAYVKWYRSQAYYDSGDWRGTWAIDGGGALMNQAIHLADQLLWLAGEVSEVFAYASTLAHERIEVEDTLIATLRFASGALGSLSAATSLWPGQPKQLDLHGVDGTVRVQDDNVTLWQVRSESDEEAARVLARYGGHQSGASADPMHMSFENHRRQIADFLAAIDEDRAPQVDGREGMRSLALVDAVYRSVRSGRPERPVDLAAYLAREASIT
jgi:UDP-N-acetyl-2-amino-2-deoxyglucuronate dehydrogenase